MLKIVLSIGGSILGSLKHFNIRKLANKQTN